MKIQVSKSSQISGVIKYQYFVTIPKSMIEALGWKKKDDIFWEFVSKDCLKLKKVDKKPPTANDRGDL